MLSNIPTSNDRRQRSWGTESSKEKMEKSSSKKGILVRYHVHRHSDTACLVSSGCTSASSSRNPFQHLFSILGGYSTARHPSRSLGRWRTAGLGTPVPAASYTLAVSPLTENHGGITCLELKLMCSGKVARMSPIRIRNRSLQDVPPHWRLHSRCSRNAHCLRQWHKYSLGR